ncbi:MAG: hypothetical protein ACW99A_10395 [Candidatus Kariarchaeaceae archaeon]|jgi:hypothetical protein
MKKQNFFQIFYIYLLFTSINLTQAKIVWEEDFESGVDNWTLRSYHYNSTEDAIFIEMDPKLELSNGVLKAPKSDTINETNFAILDSTTTHGTWSFDWIMGEQDQMLDVIVFMAHDDNNPYHDYNNIDENDLRFEGYGIVINYEPFSKSIDLMHYLGPGSDKFGEIIDYRSVGILTKTTHFDITRNETGHISVYINSDHLFTHQNLATPTSSTFVWGSWMGDTSIDNIEVDDEDIFKTSKKDDTPLIFDLWVLSTLVATLVVFRKSKIQKL